MKTKSATGPPMTLGNMRQLGVQRAGRHLPQRSVGIRVQIAVIYRINPAAVPDLSAGRSALDPVLCDYHWMF